VIAHVLNGVINRPARDAMLLNHALTDLSSPASESSENPRTSAASVSSRHEKKDRVELLISRLVRLHWDRQHMARVKQDYRELYRSYLEDDIEHFVKGSDFREFCIRVCESGR